MRWGWGGVGLMGGKEGGGKEGGGREDLLHMQWNIYQHNNIVL